MVRENPSWGYTRLRGALQNLGLGLGRSTIQRILTEHGIEPAPLRGKTMPWKTFLKAHWGAIAAADFFSVEVLTRGGLVRHLVLFVIDLKTRRVHVAGVTCRADGEWMGQVARNLTDATAGPLTGFGHLIVDRDPLYTAHFQALLQVAGVKLLRLPSRSPNLNAYAERFVRSIKHECLRHIIAFGERHLRAVVREFVEHYHAERNHQGLGNVIPFPSRDSASPSGASADAKGSAACSPSTGETPPESERSVIGTVRDGDGAHHDPGALSTSCTISGCRAITASSVRAGPSGVRLPCSQSRTVATFNPNTRAKLACVRPSRLRIGSTSIVSGGWYSRTGRSTSPRAQATASEKLSISASPTAGLWRFFAGLARLVTVALHELVAKLHQDFLLRRVDVLLHVLRVDVQQ